MFDSIRTSTVTNDSDIVAELTSLMTSDLTSIKKKENSQTKKQQQVGEDIPRRNALTASTGFP